MRKYVLFFMINSLFSVAMAATIVHKAQEQTIKVSPNQPEFTVNLQSTPGTGYSWELSAYDKSTLQLQKHQYIKPNTNLIGAAGSEAWTFKALPTSFGHKAKTSIKFLYRRPWKNTDTTTKVNFIVEIE